jgi:hypothetical protein
MSKPGSTTTPKASLRKADRAPSDPLPRIPLPRTLRGAIAALVGLLVAHAFNVLSLSTGKAGLRTYFTNTKAGKKTITTDIKNAVSDQTKAVKSALTALTKAHKSVKPTVAQINAATATAKAHNPVRSHEYYVNQTVHTQVTGAVAQSVFVTVICVLVIVLMRRTRTASSSRWLLVIGLLLTTQPFYLEEAGATGFPTTAKWSGVAIGLVSIAAIVLTLLPESSAYFRACRDAVMPPELRAQQRPGLFAPRRPVGGATAGPTAGPTAAAGTSAVRAGTRPAQTRPASSPAASGKARAKVRTDSEAISRGAELARSRAKSSKSRRTEV